MKDEDTKLISFWDERSNQNGWHIVERTLSLNRKRTSFVLRKESRSLGWHNLSCLDGQSLIMTPSTFTFYKEWLLTVLYSVRTTAMLVAGKWRGSIIVNSQWISHTLRAADALRRGERLVQHPKSPPLMLMILPILARELNDTLVIFDGFVHCLYTESGSFSGVACLDGLVHQDLGFLPCDSGM
jgi:hypothetical protein